MGDCECFLDDFGCQTVDLEVHLDRGDALVSARDLEIHVAVEVLETLNVDHCRPCAVLGGDQTAGNSGNRRGDRHTCVHQRESRAADRRLRSRAVRRNDLGDQTDCIGEFLDRGQNRHERTLSERSVSYFTASRAARCLSFTGGVARHIVVVHIALRLFLVDSVEQLCVGDRSEGCDRHDLSLTAREDSRAVSSRQEADLCGERTDLIHAAAVDALVILE